MRFKGPWPNEIMKEKVVGGETRSPFWLAQIYVLYPTAFNLWNGSAFSWRSLGEHGGIESIGMIRYAAQPLPFFWVKAANGRDLFHAPAIINVNPKRPFTCNLTYCLDDWSCYT